MTEPIKEPTEDGALYYIRDDRGETTLIVRSLGMWRALGDYESAEWSEIVGHYAPVAIEPVARPSWERPMGLTHEQFVKQAKAIGNQADTRKALARMVRLVETATAHQPPPPPLVVPAHPSGPQGTDISPERKAALESMQRFLDKREEHQAIMARWFDLVRRDPERVLQTMLRDLGPLNDALAESRRKDEDER